jgi:putative intracellular protease/amidase
MEIAILLYDRMTALDAMGPFEVLAALPGAEVRFVARERGEVRVQPRSLGLVADYAIADVTAADVLVVPGGFGDEAVCRDPRMLDWVRAIHQTTTWTTSVCTGSLILGAAGVLRGLRATGHWLSLDTLRQYGATPTPERVVEQGKVMTAAGVSSGIDMALRLVQRIAGDDVAQAIQLAIEYDPQPPFSAGSPAKAPAHVVALVKSMFEQLAPGRAAAEIGTAPA